MQDISGLYRLEALAEGNTCIHRLHSRAKLLTALIYVVCVASFGRYEAGRLAPYAFYPAVMTALAGIPFSLLAKRMAAALPFCAFAGLSGLVFERGTLFTVAGIEISCGAAAFAALLIKLLLCTAAVLILVAVTPLRELGCELRRMRVPETLVTLLEMTYRYIGTLAGEASGMYTAYTLRSKGSGVALGDMGSFTGQLLLRSADRAERVYKAMKCRGYAAPVALKQKRALTGADIAFIALCGGSSLAFRMIDIPLLLERML